MWRLMTACLPLLGIVLSFPIVSAGQEPGGLHPGAKAPAFHLKDQAGRPQQLDSLAGPNGLLLLFFRSADWCPFCKGQLVDLEAAQKAFAAKGVNVAAISYDSSAILADFAKRRSITYPLLSDSGSKVIDQFGIRNPEGAGIEKGIPYPGYYLIDRQGTIQKRFFETAYVNRLTASNLYSYLYGSFALPQPASELANTPHVTVTTSQSDSEVTPGSLVRLVVTITPGPDTHIYAPGAEKQQYHVTTLSISPSELYQATPVSYPPGQPFTFVALKETVPVYTGATALSSSVAATVNQQTIPAFTQNPHLSIKGELEYQACTATTCFAPVKTPVQWALTLKPLDRERAPEAIQHKP